MDHIKNKTSRRIKGAKDYEIYPDGVIISYKRLEPTLLEGTVQDGAHVYGIVYDKEGERSRSAHLLVAENFLPNPHNCKRVRHKNGNKLDNRVENLEWVIPAKIKAKLESKKNGPADAPTSVSVKPATPVADTVDSKTGMELNPDRLLAMISEDRNIAGINLSLQDGQVTSLTFTF